ncbi:MAG: hypothetical protein GY765_01205 [bacterium]|nr:hypothetical protein [bacterium]
MSELKVFITANGEILPCERIGQSFSLANVDEKGVNIDYQNVADKYNAFYGKIMGMCNECANSDACGICLFNLDIRNQEPVCDSFMGKDKLKKHLRQSISILEDVPQYYPRIMRRNE